MSASPLEHMSAEAMPLLLQPPLGGVHYLFKMYV